MCYQNDMLDKLPGIVKKKMEYLNTTEIKDIGCLCDIPIEQVELRRLL